VSAAPRPTEPLPPPSRRDARALHVQGSLERLAARGQLVVTEAGTSYWLARPGARARVVRLWPHNGAVFDPADGSLTINAGLPGALARLDGAYAHVPAGAPGGDDDDA
jgi:hypothetical protein